MNGHASAALRLHCPTCGAKARRLVGAIMECRSCGRRFTNDDSDLDIVVCRTCGTPEGIECPDDCTEGREDPHFWAV